MTTTACDDQFVINTERHITMYSIEAILRRNVADLEIALRKQTERAEAAEAELAKLAQQKPVAWVDYIEHGDGSVTHNYSKEPCATYARPLFAAPVPANQPQSGVLAVPAEWREVLSVLIGIVESSTKFHGCSDVTKQARALLQSAEVKK